LLGHSFTTLLGIPRDLYSGNCDELREEQIFINPVGYSTGRSENCTWFGYSWKGSFLYNVASVLVSLSYQVLAVSVFDLRPRNENFIHVLRE
jgi:hypothetical protein